MNRSKQKGTAWETAIVDYLRPAFPSVERRTLQGTHDRGDIAGIPGVVIEAKNCQTVTLPAWIDEANREAANDGGSLGVTWHKRRGKTSPGDGIVSMSGDTWLQILIALDYARNMTAEMVAAAIERRAA